MINIVEVGPRDGLQNETAPVPTAAKIAFIDALSNTGVNEIEVSAFVSPKWVPQLDDAEDVFRGIARKDGVVYSALVPNEQGLARAMAVGVDKIAVFTGASETFNLKNINTTTEGSIHRFKPVVNAAAGEGLVVRGYVSTAFWCAYEGQIAPELVLDVVKRLDDIGVHEMSISDTIGKATPDEVRRLLDMLLPVFPADRIALHFHDTYGRGAENVLASLEYGIRIFDSSAGGLGGCPYAPGATGNIATEDLVSALTQHGIAVNVDLDQLAESLRTVTPYLEEELRTLPPDGSPLCAGCEYTTGPVCCRKRELTG